MPQEASNWESQLAYSALSDIGMRRNTNQDSYAVVTAPDQAAWQQRGHFFMVADGMGAHAAGELASKLTVDGVAHLYRKYTDLSPPESLEKALRETNSEVHRRGQANSDFRNMGTTASVLVLLPQGALVAHIGDSRVYRFRAGRIEQLTFDHSLVWELRKAGQLSQDQEVAHSIPKNVITRSVGPNASVQVDIEGPFPVAPGDVFLLCSDGLTGKLADHELAGILAYLEPQEASQLLIDLANLRGGPDNITVIVSKVIVEMNSATHNAPAAVRSQPEESDIPQLITWVAVAVGFLVALILVLTDRYWAAGAVAVASSLLFAGAQVLRLRPVSRGETGGLDSQAGRAPYAEAAAPSAKETAAKLAELTQDLRRRDPPSFPIDWGQYDAAVESGAGHAHAKRYAKAIRDYALAVRSLMLELQSAESRKASDSALDL